MTFKCGRQFNKIPQISIRSTPIFHMNWINTKYSIFPQNWAETMPCCEISDCAQMSKTIIAVRHFGLGGRESLETAVITYADISMGNFLFEVLTWYLARPHCYQLNSKVKKKVNCLSSFCACVTHLALNRIWNTLKWFWKEGYDHKLINFDIIWILLLTDILKQSKHLRVVYRVRAGAQFD